MLKLSYKLRLNETVKAKCERHPAYDPSTKGKDHIGDRCATCREILEFYESKVSLERAVKAFERRARSWQTLRNAVKVPKGVHTLKLPDDRVNG